MIWRQPNSILIEQIKVSSPTEGLKQLKKNWVYSNSLWKSHWRFYNIYQYPSSHTDFILLIVGAVKRPTSQRLLKSNTLEKIVRSPIEIRGGESDWKDHPAFQLKQELLMSLFWTIKVFRKVEWACGRWTTRYPQERFTWDWCERGEKARYGETGTESSVRGFHSSNEG